MLKRLKLVSQKLKEYILIFLTVMLTVTGCDFFRKVAGRPTSEDIEMKRLEMMWDLEEKAAKEKAYKDSVAKAQQALKDSAAALDYLQQNRVSVITPQKLGGMLTKDLKSGYYVVLGSFKSGANAQALLYKVRAAGNYSPVLVTFRNGMVAVAAYPSDKVQDAVAHLKELKTQDFCPPDAWILKNE